MTFRLEPELHAQFTQAAEREHRPAAQVLRDLMRAYIKPVKSLRAPKPRIEAAERQRRAQALEYARASVGLEGFVLDKADEQHAQRFLNGEIDLAEFVQVRS